MAKKVDFMAGFNQATQNLPVSAFSEQEKIKKSLIVVDELKRFIPALSQEEYKQLEQNLLEHGCKDPLTIWETTEKVAGVSENENIIYVVLDGHNRFEICKNNQIDFKISTPLKFDSMDTAKDYMINHQLGRRNLNPEQISYFRGLKYISLKKEKGKYEREEHNGKIYHYENEALESAENAKENHNGKIYHYEKTTTAQDLAKEFNISEKTIRNDALFAKSVENLPAEIRTEVLQGKSSLTKAEVIEFGKTGELKTNQDEAKKAVKPLVVKDKILNLLKQSTEYLGVKEYKELISEIKLIIKSIDDLK
jgi:HTH domain